MPISSNPLLLPELFQYILDWVVTSKYPFRSSSDAAQEDRRQSRRALVALACTYRALSEPSLDYLWRKLESLEPLIRTVAPTADWSRLDVPLSPAEWRVVTRYSHRVRELVTGGPLDKSFLQSASACSQSTPLFPNLRRLRWSLRSYSRDPDLTLVMRQLFPETLVSLSVSPHPVSPQIGLQSFLQNFVSLCPRLQSLIFRHYEDTPGPDLENFSQSDIHQLSRAICTHERLEYLRICIPIDNIAMKHLMLSSELEEVSMPLYPGTLNGNICLASTEIPFRNVRKLVLHVWDLHFLSSLLRPNEQGFDRFSLHLRARHPVEDVFAVFTALASPRHTNSLHTFHFEFSRSYFSIPRDARPLGVVRLDNTIPDSDRLTYRSLYPLTSLKNLRALALNLPNFTLLNDHELENLIRSWPKLEELHLDCNNFFYQPSISSITFRGLLSLLWNCPRLRALGLPLDARQVPRETDVDVCNTIITRITLASCNAPIVDPRLVADFLSRHLPSLKSISLGLIDDPIIPRGDYRALWKEVNGYLLKKTMLV